MDAFFIFKCRKIKSLLIKKHDNILLNLSYLLILQLKKTAQNSAVLLGKSMASLC